MLGLGGYESSDDGSTTQVSQPEPEKGSLDVATKDVAKKPPTSAFISTSEPANDVEMHTAEDLKEDTESVAPGPALGPSFAPQDLDNNQQNDSDPESSYAAARAAMRNLTMPPIPNYNIPDSPPGSPPAASSKKFAQFLELKKKGVHFNSKLESSSALRNPALLQKLMDFARIDHYDQHATALPEDLAIVTSYPPWAYGEQLNNTQQQLLQKKSEEKRKVQRDRVDFVTGADNGGSSRAAAPSTSRSTAERVMAGLDRGKSKGSQRYDDRRGKDENRGGRRSRSRSR